jgi:phosphoenolpyruvate phosphomutase
MDESKTIVYVAMACDIIHHGHINIIKIAQNYGNVIVGLLTDNAITSYKRIPYFEYAQRKLVIENIKGVEKVVPQETLDYVENLEKLKPKYVVHGSDWKDGPQKTTRNRVINTLKKWGGELIEPEYTENISTTHILETIRDS